MSPSRLNSGVLNYSIKHWGMCTVTMAAKILIEGELTGMKVIVICGRQESWQALE